MWLTNRISCVGYLKQDSKGVYLKNIGCLLSFPGQTTLLGQKRGSMLPRCDLFIVYPNPTSRKLEKMIIYHIKMDQTPAPTNGSGISSQELIIVSETSETEQQATQQVHDPVLSSQRNAPDFVNVDESHSQNPEVTKPKEYTQLSKPQKTKRPNEEIYAAERMKRVQTPKNEDIAKVAALPMKERNQALPSAFDEKGRLRTCWQWEA